MRNVPLMDRESLEAAVRAHQAEIYRYLRYLGADNASAEDLVQDTFLTALKKGIPNVDNIRTRSAWLRAVARNLFLNHCRRNKRSQVKVDSELLDRAESTWSSEFLHGGDGYDYVEAMRKCLGKLSERHRSFLDMRYAQAKSRSEMASHWEIAQDSVKSLLRRLRAALAKCVRKELELETP